LHNFISLKNYDVGNRNGVKFAGHITHLGQMVNSFKIRVRKSSLERF